ncbi:hypothetical protein BHY_1213 (plasmid) [Borrelia nietonii YOR]|uniref:Uncharacterized protein n=1 Tax=Borrelia nietonii YOR TaxID=1293576 RepID=W5SAN7_9SPIR|nr:hypothetical protein BHY_1213 [Borrelia nietonii YOR]
MELQLLIDTAALGNNVLLGNRPECCDSNLADEITKA